MDLINGKQFREMLESGCNNLNNRKKEVDALNVFLHETNMRLYRHFVYQFPNSL